MLARNKKNDLFANTQKDRYRIIGLLILIP